MPAHKLKPQVLINLLISVIMGVLAQLLMKYGMSKLKKLILKINTIEKI